MKAVLSGICLAALLAALTWQASQSFNIPAEVPYATEGARVTPLAK